MCEDQAAEKSNQRRKKSVTHSLGRCNLLIGNAGLFNHLEVCILSSKVRTMCHKKRYMALNYENAYTQWNV